MHSSASGGDPDEPAPPYPSDTPIEGRPLLRDGRVLVYPEGFACEACGNTGFTSDDAAMAPHAACTVCWQKYARPFNSVLARFFRRGGATRAERARLQRPLGMGVEGRFSAPAGLDAWDRMERERERERNAEVGAGLRMGRAVSRT